MNTITTDYRDHVITYDPESNLWNCDAFINRQGSPSLLLAQKRIDKIIDGEPAKPKFKKVEAWYDHQWKGWTRVTISAKAEDAVFVTDKVAREKVRSHAFYKLAPCNPDNDALIAEIKKLEDQVTSLRNQISNKETELETYKP